ncbi:MAG: methyltransferase domain-containing protein [Opitutae bacterium]|nr:methyltransferase domain-containing protein [Opitutae bacterium]
MRSWRGKIPRFRDVEFIAEEAIAIKVSARTEEEKRLLAKNIQLIEDDRDPEEEKEQPDWRVFPIKKTYRLKALLQLNQFDFIFNVFRALLGRNPNPEEMWTQVEVIRKDKLSKLTYFMNLRGVEESKVHNSSFCDADRGIKLFGRFFKVGNLGSIRDIEIYLRGSESIFDDTEDLERRLEDLRDHYRNMASYWNVVAEAFEVEMGNAQERAGVKETSGLEERVKTVLETLERSYGKRLEYDESEMEEVYLVDAPNYYEIGKDNGEKVNAEAREKYRGDYDYYIFENVFYDPEVVKRKQTHYLPLLAHARESKRRFLDLGCGRGEFLKLLKGYGIEGVGVELNPIECEILRQDGLKVYREDIFKFIAENESLWSGVSLLHVIEHLEKDKTARLFDDLFQMMEPGGILIVETINPHCPKSFGSFFMDHTHIIPHTPEGIAFQMQRAGLEDVRILYSNLIDVFHWSPERKANYHDFGVIGRKAR